jgi:hypothetical protein
MRYDTCYKPAIDVLKFLIDPKAGGEPDPDHQLSASDRDLYRSSFLQVRPSILPCLLLPLPRGLNLFKNGITCKSVYIVF